MIQIEQDSRGCGEYWVLDNATTPKVKRIQVNAGGRLSYQYQFHGSEVWTVVSGIARSTLDGTIKDYSVGETAIISSGMHHSVKNYFEETLLSMEVQHGTYFAEDDIVRIEKDYQSA